MEKPDCSDENPLGDFLPSDFDPHKTTALKMDISLEAFEYEEPHSDADSDSCSYNRFEEQPTVVISSETRGMRKRERPEQDDFDPTDSFDNIDDALNFLDEQRAGTRERLSFLLNLTSVDFTKGETGWAIDETTVDKLRFLLDTDMFRQKIEEMGKEAPQHLRDLARDSMKGLGFDMDLQKQLGEKFMIVGQYGKGMAKTFVALDLEKDELVVMKHLDFILSALECDNEDPEETKMRFIRECHTLHQLQHPHIVQLHDDHVFLSENAGVIVLKWGGVDLSRILCRKRLPLKGTDSELDVLTVFRSLLSAVQFLHDQGVIHRDIKPANILIDKNQVRLVDFGISYIQKDEFSQLTHPSLWEYNGEYDDFETRSSLVLGTPVYMDPQVYMNSRYRPNKESDIYAMGVVFFLLLTGKTPHPYQNLRASDFLKYGQQILNNPPVNPSTMNTEVPVKFGDIVLRMLSVDPKNRPSLDFVQQHLKYFE